MSTNSDVPFDHFAKINEAHMSKVIVLVENYQTGVW